MAFAMSAARTNAALDTLVDEMDSGAIVGYTGSAPATVDDTATGSEVFRCPLNATAFSAAAENGTNARATMQTSSVVQDTDADGNASAVGYFRVESSVGTDLAQGTITATAGGGDIELGATTIGAGSTVTISSFTIDLPQAGS